MGRFLALCLLVFGARLWAQQPTTTTAVLPTNAQWLQGVGTGFWPTAGSGLTLNIAAGTAFFNSSVVNYAGGTLTMAASSTNYVYLNPAAACAPASSTNSFSAGQIPLATVVASSTVITSVPDVRNWFVPQSVLTDPNGKPTVKQLNNVRFASQYGGADPGAKISACITDLPSTGGTCDARGLEGAQTISTDVFSSVSKPVRLVLGAGAYTVSATATIPTNVSLDFSEGASLTIADGVTVTINGNIIAPVSSILAYSGTGKVVLGGRNTQQAFPQWWGAKGGGVADDTGAIVQAVNALVANGGRVSFPAGRYLISAPVPLRQGVAYVGLGSPQSTQIKILASGIFPLDMPIAKNGTGGTGTVNTSGTTVTWVSGLEFPTDGIWNNATITIKGTNYTVRAVVNSATQLTLTSSAGTQSGVSYSVATSEQEGVLMRDLLLDAGNRADGVWFDDIRSSSMWNTRVFNASRTNDFGFTIKPSATGDSSVDFLYDVWATSAWGGIHFSATALSHPVFDVYLYGSRFQTTQRGIYVDANGLGCGAAERVTVVGSIIDTNSSSSPTGVENQGCYNRFIGIDTENTSASETGFLDMGADQSIYESILVSGGYSTPYNIGALNHWQLGSEIKAANGDQFFFFQQSGDPASVSTNGTLLYSTTGGTPSGMLRAAIGAGAPFNLVGDTLTQTLTNKTLSSTSLTISYQNFTSNTTLTSSQCGYVLSNNAATGGVTFTLPGPPIGGCTYSFVVRAAQTLTVKASSNASVRVNGSVSAANGTASSSTAGNALVLVGTDATEWDAVSSLGTWTVQ